MTHSRAMEIIGLAQYIKKKLSNNPFKIADHVGIKYSFSNASEPSAKIFKVNGYPTIMMISGCSSDTGKIVLCAHELGHYFLHDGVNAFNGSFDAIKNDIEHEANLFAVALLFDQNDFNMPIHRMQNYILKEILDYNLS